MLDTANGFLTALNTYGPAVVIIAVLLIVNGCYVWRGWRREDKLELRLAKLEEDTREMLVPLVKDCRTTIQHNSEVILQLIGLKSGMGS